jgi:hypothetical protein
MVIVEVIMQKKVIVVGPFESQAQATRWVRQILRENSGETAIISSNDDTPDTLRVYIGEPADRPAKDFLRPVFDLFRAEK